MPEVVRKISGPPEKSERRVGAKGSSVEDLDVEGGRRT